MLSRTLLILRTTGRLAVVLALLAFFIACDDPEAFDPSDPARGPASMIEVDGTVSDGDFAGGDDPEVSARDVDPPEGDQLPDCGSDCVSFCESQGFENPVHRGLCPSTWGVGLEPSPIDETEACRRLHVDTIGRFPTDEELDGFCDGRPWGEIVSELLDSDEFVEINQRRWADKLMYNTGAISIERIYDMDKLVGMLYEGKISYDHFAAITSAHPVLTRRHDNAGDRAEELFHLFVGRPPLGAERSDIARLYTLWDTGYYDHPELGMRLSDAHINHRCVDDDGNIDEDTRGECTSVLYGYNELILEPDIRVDPSSDTMWSGLLYYDEWYELQLPGRLIAGESAFWENAVDSVLDQYLDYELTQQVPEVRGELVDHLHQYNGDIRSVHHAVLTSAAYLQSAAVQTPTEHRWTVGPLKQVQPEAWIDTMKANLDLDLASCDHRITTPGEFADSGTPAAMAVLEHSNWELEDDGEDIRSDYRDLAGHLGGCPANEVGGRFQIISILTTASQLSFVDQICDLEGGDDGADIAKLLPQGTEPDRAVTPQVAEEIVEHQIGMFFGRDASDEERAAAREHGETCELEVCRAHEFARPACFAHLSSSEMLFY